MPKTGSWLREGVGEGGLFCKHILNQRPELSKWACHRLNLLIIDYCFVRSRFRRHSAVPTLHLFPLTFPRVSLPRVCCHKLKMQIAQMIAPAISAPFSGCLALLSFWPFPSRLQLCLLMFAGLGFLLWLLLWGKTNFHKFLKQTHELKAQKEETEEKESKS